jgi:conjugative transfer region protein (TIGR03750 family)
MASTMAARSHQDPSQGPAAHHVRTWRTPTTDRVNAQPPILNGMTASEAKAISLVALGVWVGMGVAVTAIVGVWQLMLLFAIVLPLVTIWLVSSKLAAIKRDRPHGYHQQLLHRWCAARGLAQSRFIARNGYWSLGRRLPPWPSASGSPREHESAAPHSSAFRSHATRTMT